MAITSDLIEEYLELLAGPAGCDFRTTDPDDPRTTTWRCGGGRDKSYSQAILAELGLTPEEVDEILTLADEHGGHCDCEILFNAEDVLCTSGWQRVAASANQGGE